MAVTAVVGAQWGDEGKGRVVDYLAQRADLVIRFQGGDNAGHTVVNDKGEFALHMIPSGIFNPDTVCVVGAGTVVNPPNLMAEMDMLFEAGLTLDNLIIDRRAHVVLPIHPELDALREANRAEADRIGTTKRGIGPAYADKAARTGIRMGDLLRPDYLRSRLEQTLPARNRMLTDFGRPAIDLEELVAQCASWGEQLKNQSWTRSRSSRASSEWPPVLRRTLGVCATSTGVPPLRPRRTQLSVQHRVVRAFRPRRSMRCSGSSKRTRPPLGVAHFLVNFWTQMVKSSATLVESTVPRLVGPAVVAGLTESPLPTLPG